MRQSKRNSAENWKQLSPDSLATFTNMLTLGHILAALSDYQPTATDPTIAIVTNDSRDVQANSLFVAFVGEQLDGHQFCRQAFDDGAIAAIVTRPVDDFALVDVRDRHCDLTKITTPLLILVEDSEKALQQCAHYWRRQHSVRVIGITGSVGKTSTKELAYQVLSQKYCTLKSEKNYNTEIGLPIQLLNLRAEHEMAVLEMGMYVRGDIALLASIAEPDVGVITNVGTVHVERAGSVEAIALGKRELVEALPKNGLAILNNDDTAVIVMRDHTDAEVMTYGMTPEADLWASDIESMGLDGIRFALNYRGEKIFVNAPLLGRHSVQTALRASAIGLAHGLDWGEIVRGLQEQPEQLRLLVADGINGSRVIDDSYNANPQSTIAALNLLDDLRGRKVAVLGDMLELGSESSVGHKLVGRRAADVVDEMVVIGQEGRMIGEEALIVGFDAQKLHFSADSEHAIPIVKNLIEPNDIVLVKGSLGAKMGLIVKAILKRSDNID